MKKRKQAAWAALAGAGFAAAAALWGCGGGDSAVSKAKLPDGVRSQSIEHESCNESGHRVEAVDVNNDGRPDIKRVYDGQHEVCRISDLNHDGKPDMFEYYDKTGALRRRESDYDDNGVVNEIQFYENGKKVRAELDTTNQGRIDTWDVFDAGTGKLTKRERDTTGDGRVDQWWTYEGDKVTIAMDKNGDGKPDPESVITLGANGVAVPMTDAGGPVATAVDAGPPPAPAEPPPADTSAPSAPSVGIVDAGPPKRGAAKR